MTFLMQGHMRAVLTMLQLRLKKFHHIYINVPNNYILLLLYENFVLTSYSDR